MNVQNLTTAQLHDLRSKTTVKSILDKVEEELQFRNDISYSPMSDMPVQMVGFPYDTFVNQRFPANDVQNNALDAGESF